jgi:hypothetical protein
MNTLLAQLVATEERLSRLQHQLAVKRAVVHEAATLLRVGADPAVVASGLVRMVQKELADYEGETR